jgi:hypothetical protein
MSRHGSKKPKAPPIMHHCVGIGQPICGAKLGEATPGVDGVTCRRCLHFLQTRKYKFQ